VVVVQGIPYPLLAYQTDVVALLVVQVQQTHTIYLRHLSVQLKVLLVMEHIVMGVIVLEVVGTFLVA
jgi:hypothetical protein